MHALCGAAQGDVRMCARAHVCVRACKCVGGMFLCGKMCMI